MSDNNRTGQGRRWVLRGIATATAVGLAGCTVSTPVGDFSVSTNDDGGEDDGGDGTGDDGDGNPDGHSTTTGEDGGGGDTATDDGGTTAGSDATTATDQPATGTPTQTQPESGEPQLTASVYTVSSGDVADIGLWTGNTIQLAVQIGSEDVNFVARGSIQPDSADLEEPVTIRFRTGPVKESADRLELEGKAELTVDSVTEYVDTLDPGSYPITVRVPGHDGSTYDVGSLSIS